MYQDYDEAKMEDSYMQAVGTRREDEEQLNNALLESLKDSNENENKEKEKEKEEEKEKEKEKKEEKEEEKESMEEEEKKD